MILGYYVFLQGKKIADVAELINSALLSEEWKVKIKLLPVGKLVLQKKLSKKPKKFSTPDSAIFSSGS